MGNKQKRYVTMKNPPESGHSELIFAEFGRVYEIRPDPLDGYISGPKAFYIKIFPEGLDSFCLFKGCVHLLGGDWVECDAEGNLFEEKD